MKKIATLSAVAALAMSSAAFAGGYGKKGETPVEPEITPAAVIQPSSAGAGSLGGGAGLALAAAAVVIAAVASDSDDAASTTTSTAP